MATERDYKRYAAREAATILELYLQEGCIFGLDTVEAGTYSHDDPEHLDRVTDCIRTIVAELYRRGQLAPTAAELLGETVGK